MSPDFDPRRIELLDPEMVAVLKAKTPAERVTMGFAMHEFAKGVLFSRIQSQHPDWTKADIDAAVAKRMCRGEL